MSEIYAKDLVLTNSSNNHNILDMMGIISEMLSDVYGIFCDDKLLDKSHKDNILFVSLDNISYTPVLNIHHTHKNINYVCTFDKDCTLNDLHTFLEKKHEIHAIEKLMDKDKSKIFYDRKKVHIKGFQVIFPKIFEIKDKPELGPIGIIIFEHNILSKMVGNHKHYGLYFSKLPMNAVPALKKLKKYKVYSL